MKPFEASSPAVEVSGAAILSFVGGLGWRDPAAMRALANHGLAYPSADQWYKQQLWLDTFREIAQTLGPNTLYMIGMQIPINALFPAGISGIQAALAAIDPAYRMNHRGGEIGSYACTATGPNSATLVCDNPYPSDFDRGIIQAMANRYRPEGCQPKVALDLDRETRKSGGNSCTYRVTW
jgi:hypothetical protein